jgi:hypothetical protein
MRSSAATDEYTRAETDPLCHFRHHRPAPTIKLRGPQSRVSARSRRGPGSPREGVQWHRRSADQTQLHAAPCAWTTHSLRHLLSRAANVLICLMSARSIPCMSLRCLHGHPCMTGGGAHSAEADDFPPAMAVALVTWVSQMATNTIESSIPLPPRLGAPRCLCWCSAPTTLLPPRCSGPCPVHGADRRDVGYGRIS